MLRYLKYHVLLQGQKVEANSVEFSCGVGAIPSALIVLPPKRNAYHIWPGTKVTILLETEETGDNPIWAFEGAVENYPTQHVGRGAKSISLICTSDFDTLRDSRLRFSPFTKTGKTPYNQWASQFIGQKMDGNVDIPSTMPKFGVGQGIGSLIRDPKVSMRKKLFGVLQAILLMNPTSYAALRRTQFLDRMMIETAEEAASLFIRTELFSQALTRIASISQDISLWDYLQMVLRVIQHDVVSVCPYIQSTFDIPNRFSHFYAPSTFDEYIKTGEAKVTDYIATQEKKSVIEMFIKPTLVGSADIPECNVLYPSQYEGFNYTKSITPTRGFYINQAALNPKAVITAGHRFKPDELNEVYAQINKRSRNASVAATSRIIGTRGNDYTTNEEKMTGIKNMFRGQVDPILDKVLRGLNPKSSKGAEAINDMIDYMWMQQRMGQVQVTGPFNIKAIPGFPILFLDHKFGNHLIGHLDSRSCSMDTQGGGNTTYTVSGARPIRSSDFNMLIKDKDGAFTPQFALERLDDLQIPWINDYDTEKLALKFNQKMYATSSYSQTDIDNKAKNQAPVVDSKHADVHDMMGNLGVVTDPTLTKLKGGLPGVEGYEYKERYFVAYDAVANGIENISGDRVEMLDAVPADMGLMTIEVNRSYKKFSDVADRLGLRTAIKSTKVVNSWKDLPLAWKGPWKQYAKVAKDGIKISDAKQRMYYPVWEGIIDMPFLYDGNPGYSVTDVLLWRLCQRDVQKDSEYQGTYSKIKEISAKMVAKQKERDKMVDDHPELADTPMGEYTRNKGAEIGVSFNAELMSDFDKLEAEIKALGLQLAPLQKIKAPTRFGMINQPIPFPLSEEEVIIIRKAVIEAMNKEHMFHG